MDKNNLAHFVYHSGVILEYEDRVLIVDYFKEENEFLLENLIPENKDTYFLVTHSHYDHFHEEIFKYYEKYKERKTIKFIFSFDIRDSELYLKYKDNVYLSSQFIDIYREFCLDDMNIKAFGSTDKGVSFLINYKDTLVFHSGDLNYWHWKSFSKDEQEIEREDYLKEVYKLKDYLSINNLSLDLAFIPLDPRLEEHSDLAIILFLENINTNYLMPIHLRDNLSVIESFINKHENLKQIIVRKGHLEF